MPKAATVLVTCNRKGSVSAGPLVLVAGSNEVSKADFDEFKETKLGANLIANGDVEIFEPPKPTKISQPPKAKPVVTEPAGEGDAGGDAASSEGDASVAPSLAFGIRKAVKFIAECEDEDALVLCYEQDERKGVQKAIEKRSLELE